VNRLPVVPVRRRWALALVSAGGAVALAAAMAPAAAAATHAHAATAARASGTVTYHGTSIHATRLAKSTNGLRGLPAVKPKATATVGKPRVIPFRSPNGSYPGKGGVSHAASRNPNLARVAGDSFGSSGVSVTHNFNGIDNNDNQAANGFVLTPPDQGLCVIPGKPNAVVEAVNEVVRFTSPNGTALLPDVPLSTIFQDPNASGDVRCLYDPATKSVYFTEIGFDGSGNTTVDIAVLNGNGAAAYQISSADGGACFGDQPKTGFDNNALIISTDAYCGPGQNTESGADVFALSKAQLVALAPLTSGVEFQQVSLGGIPGLGLDPAINTGTGTGYLVNSFPFDANGNNNSISHSLGLWTLTGDKALNTGSGTIKLCGMVIGSEYYAFPVPATSTGDGSVTNVGGTPVTSEAVLNADDSRTSGPVMVTHSHGRVQLWTALDSAVLVGNDPADRDGAAWFQVDTGKHRVVNQGYVAVKGQYLLYPALMKPANGPAAMVFTVTSGTINPSAAFTTLGSKKITTVAAGAGPHVSFSDVLFNEPRWGDYSFVAPSPNGKGVWMATEYIPAAPDQNALDNWGTQVFQVSK
jgi:hypothetical protein